MEKASINNNNRQLLSPFSPVKSNNNNDNILSQASIAATAYDHETNPAT
jgi:hypothetical protein